jgi:multidrug resistance efflux pump
MSTGIDPILGVSKEVLAERLRNAMKNVAEANAAVRPYMDSVESYRERVQSMQAICETAAEMVWAWDRRHDLGQDDAEVIALELTDLIREAAQKGHVARWLAERCGE